MCGRYNLTRKTEAIEEDLSIEIIERELFNEQVNIAPGDKAPVLVYPEIHHLQWFQFGMTPYWSQKKMYVFNARSEGNSNLGNHINYKGNKGILQKPMFRKPIRSQRCLVIANSFIEWSSKEKSHQPHLFFRNDFKCFTMGGVWDEWIDKTTGEILHSFAIITTPASSITLAIEHPRAPLIIPETFRQEWLYPKTPLPVITNLLQIFDGKDFNAFPIHPDIGNPRDKNKANLYPVGEAFKKNIRVNILEGLELQGMGETRARKRKEKE